MLCWLRQQLGENVFEMISLLGFNAEFIMSLQVYGLLQYIINSLKSSSSLHLKQQLRLLPYQVRK